MHGAIDRPPVFPSLEGPSVHINGGSSGIGLRALARAREPEKVRVNCVL